MARYGGFDHNAQSCASSPSWKSDMPSFDGLNLTWETLEGLVKHNGPLLRPGRSKRCPSRSLADCAKQDLELQTYPSASRHKLPRSRTTSPITTTTSTTATVPGYSPSPSLPRCRSPVAFSRRSRGLSRHRLYASPLRDEPPSDHRDDRRCDRRDAAAARRARSQSADDVRRAKQLIVAFSPPMQQELEALSAFLLTRVYRIRASCAS